jgi:hypothetical protein
VGMPGCTHGTLQVEVVGQFEILNLTLGLESNLFGRKVDSWTYAPRKHEKLTSNLKRFAEKIQRSNRVWTPARTRSA